VESKQLATIFDSPQRNAVNSTNNLCSSAIRVGQRPGSQTNVLPWWYDEFGRLM